MKSKHASKPRRHGQLGAGAQGSASGGDSLNEQYRNGGDLVEDADPGQDSISAMRLAHQRSDVLANALLEMGITENGDGVSDDNGDGVLDDE